MKLYFSRLTDISDTDDFDCQEEELNAFLKNMALLFQKRHFAVTMLSYLSEECSGKVVGYYTVCPASVTLEELPEKYFTGPKPNPIPAFRLCRLAVDKIHQGKGYGKILMIHALKKCLEHTSQMGGSLIIIDAKNEKAKKFYEQFGFIPTHGNPLTLIQSIKYIAKHFA